MGYLGPAPPAANSIGVNELQDGAVTEPKLSVGAVLSQNFIDGLELANSPGDLVNDIDIASGECVDSIDSENMILSSLLTKQIDVNWSVGSGVGGFPSGLTLTNDTWYHVFLIKRTDTGVVDAGFDTDLSAVNLLADAVNYDVFRRIGSIRRATATNLAFFQEGNHITYDPQIEDLPFAQPGATRVLRTLTVPPDVVVKAHLNVLLRLAGTSTGTYFVYSPSVATDQAPDGDSMSLQDTSATSGNTFYASEKEILTNTSSQIAERASTTSANLTRLIATLGYEDFRGKR